VRASRDALEAAGVAKTLGELQTADLVLLVFDAAAPWSENDAQLLSAAPGSIVVHNKCDLAAALTSDRPAGIQTSALTGEGVSELKQALVERLVPHVPSPGRAVPFTLRQIEALRAARHRAETGNPAAAALLLGESAHLGSD
jgi:tRNA modification GTPase